MSFSQVYFVMLLFVGYLGNVILISSYFPQESSPKSLAFLTTDSSASCACNPHKDSLELARFYKSTNGTSWKKSWDLDQPISTWFGVELNDSACVKCIDLDGEAGCNYNKNGGNNIIGHLPDLNLPHLEHLFLAGNKLKGRILDFSNIPNLLTLQLSDNKFTKSIPDFSNLPKLTSLGLDNNQLNKKLPTFKSTPALQRINCQGNKLKGIIPEYTHLTELTYLNLANNLFSKPLPQFENKPIAHFDTYKFRSSETPYTINVAANDELHGIERWSVELLTQPSVGTIVEIENGILSYQVPSGFKGTVSFDYQLLNKVNIDLVDKATVTIEVLPKQNIDESLAAIPNGISPNGDGINDKFIIPILETSDGFTDNELIVFNRYGQEVYQAFSYQNDWPSTNQYANSVLPEGTYFYVFRLKKFPDKEKSGFIELRR